MRNPILVKKGTLFIITAPSGAGKTSLVKALLEQVENLSVSISYTTRHPRANERDGEDYHFIDNTKFKDLIKQGAFLEYAKVFEYYYGTSRDYIDKTMRAGKNLILEIDWQGARQVRSQFAHCVSIFILPPNYKALSERLINRQYDDAGTIDKRMSAAREDILHYKECDYIVINEKFEQALDELKAIIAVANLDSHRQSAYFDTFVKQI